jgi:hypothetical protein
MEKDAIIQRLEELYEQYARKNEVYWDVAAMAIQRAIEVIREMGEK